MSLGLFDNQEISIMGCGDDDLKLALKFFLRGPGSWKHYVIHPKYGFVLFWAEPKGGESFQGLPIQTMPYPMTHAAVQDFILHWLNDADRGPTPSHDGDSAKAWRVYNEGWTHIGDSWKAQVAVQPVWALYGK